LGSTSYITDDHANITQYDAYLPYGELLVDEHSSSEDLPYKFNGKQFDEETGLYYYGARYMNPVASIWYGVDPLAEKYPGVAPYNYVFYNPIFFRDPNGQSAQVTINSRTKTIVISATLVFYGECASAIIASQTAADIQNSWNAPRGKVTIGKTTYSVVFKIKGEYRDVSGWLGLKKAALGIEKAFNTNPEINYIEVVKHATGGSIEGISNMDIGGNVGEFQLDNIKGSGTLTEAHEFGHNHQQLFNTAGMTEISVNMFSNMIMFTSGQKTSRSQYCNYVDVDGKQYTGVCESAVSTYADRFASKKYWFEYGTWGTTQMYYKLYLLFHATGLDNKFWNKCLDYLRRNRLSGQGTANCSGRNDYLLFAKACCYAAQQDLSSFFEAWGHFYDVNGVVIGDYSNTTMYTNRAEWEDALRFMKKFPKGPGNNLIFVDDHIRRTPAIYPGHPEGEMRSDFNDEVRVGTMGDFGSWDQFCPDSLGQGWAEVVSMKDVDGKRTYTMKAKNSHVVGFKIYDSNDKLIYFANTKTFTIPRKVMESANNNVKVVVCGSNGSEVLPGTVPTGIKTTVVQPNRNKVDVYSVYGVLIRSQVNESTALDGLADGVYIVGDKKVIVGKH